MCAVENGCEFIWVSSHQAKRIPLSALSFLQQVGLISSLEPLWAFNGYLCLMPQRFFPILVNKDKGFVMKRWRGAYRLLQENHFRLLYSPNGSMQIERGAGSIYLNGQAIRKAILQDGDWILAGGYSFFWSDPLLLSPSLLADSFHQGLPFYQVGLRPRENHAVPTLFQSSLKPMIFKVEAPPVFHDEELKLTSAHAGGMMILSTITSALSALLLQGRENQIQGVLPAFLSAIGFMGFYAWQSKRGQNEKKIANRDSLEQYLTYLKEQLEIIESLRQEKQTQFLAQKRCVLHFDPLLKHSQTQNAWSLPIALFKTPCLTLEIPELSWQFQSSPQGQALAQMKKTEVGIPAWNCLSQGEVAFIRLTHDHQLEQLYTLWCWMVFTPQRRFAWIGFSPPSRLHPASLLEGEKLYFKTFEDYLAYKTRFSNIEWTICVHESLVSNLDLFTIFSSSFSRSSFESLSGPSLWPKSASFKETWLLCLKEPTFQISHHTFQSVPLFFPSTPLDSKIWRQSAYGPPFSQENFALPRFCQNLETSNPDFTLPCLANLKVEIGPGIFWDLKQEGPHALVAGVTGSGKSEGLCSILFQLAFQNSARLLQFVLIDFKGGSFSVPLQDLPHTVARLTNLASQEIVRLEKALHDELDRRQRILAEFLIKHPDHPPDLDHCLDPKTGKMFSHILICVDEFGQLKARFPDFMKFLQESARIGRSLGLHLILSTQKPAGLVDEQIWANAKTKICFPVLDGADSREVLGHDGATHLTKSGEFILQVTGESEKKGRAFYLKRAANGDSALFLKVQETWHEKPAFTLQEALRQSILNRKESRDPLLIEDPKHEVETFSGIVIDRLTHTDPFSLPHGLTIAIGQNLEIFLAQLTWTCRKENRISLNASLFSIPYTKPTTLSSLWSIESSLQANDCSIVIFVEVDRLPMALLEMLLRQKRLTLVLFGSQISFRQEFILSKATLKLLVQVSSKDQLALISEGRIRQEEGFPIVHALYSTRIDRLIVGKRNPLKKEEKLLTPLPSFGIEQVQKEATIDSLFHIKPGLIALEDITLKPIYLSPLGLTIAWSLSSAKEQALNLGMRLQLENPLLEIQDTPTKGQVCLLDTSKSLDPANDLKQAMEKMPVLFLGKGLSAWQYLLQLNLPLETNGNGLYIEKGIGRDVQSATFQETPKKEA